MLKITAKTCWTAQRSDALWPYAGLVVENPGRSSPTVWEYREFEIPSAGGDLELLNWLREGWELVGVHPKGKGQRKPAPFAIMRRIQLEQS